MPSPPTHRLRAAAVADLPLILAFIRELADYEKLSAEVEATEEKLRATLFPENGRPAAECLLAFAGDAPAGFAVYFTTYSTFLARPGIWLEDLFVRPEFRGRGLGRALLLQVAKLAARSGGRMEWSVLDWNRPAVDFYESLGARCLTDWTVCRLAGADLAQYA